MTLALSHWAATWNIPPAALADLQQRLTVGATVAPAADAGRSEASVSVRVRLEASRAGVLLYRNNVGAAYMADGTFLRYGLANDSKALNASVKSGDLIGLRPVLIGPEHVGCILGQFVSRECKAEGWRYTGTERERAQLKWAQLVVANGGDACFATGEGTL